MKNIISTDKAPAAIGPYSQAVEVNGLVFTSGVVPIDPATGELAGTPIKTGDHANVMLYVLLSLAAVSAMGLVVVFGKKRAN